MSEPDPNVVDFVLPAFDGITFHAERRADNDDCPHNWMIITATGIDGNPIPDFRAGFAGP